MRIIGSVNSHFFHDQFARLIGVGIMGNAAKVDKIQLVVTDSV